MMIMQLIEIHHSYIIVSVFITIKDKNNNSYPQLCDAVLSQKTVYILASF